MDPKAQFVFFLLAFICFTVAALWSAYPAADGNRRFLVGNVNLVALGLSFWSFVLLYTAYKAV